MATEKKPKQLYEFGPFRLDVDERLLLRAGEAVPLAPKTFDVLLAFVEQPGHLLGKEALLKAVWPDSFVEENNLTDNIFRLRRALGEGENGWKFIETIPKRGYRFVASVKECDEIPAPLGAAMLRSLTNNPTTSVAVLPFLDLSAKKDHEYFSDGLTEELINVLAKVEGLRVVARTSSFQFKGQNRDIREIGQQLNVGAILEGSVRVDERRLRITVHLNNVADGYQLWSETYDRDLQDVFAIQEEIAHAIVGTLRIRLGRERHLGLRSPHTPTPEAYRLYLQGRYFVNKLTEAGFAQGIQFFEQALALDPQYGAALAGLAEAYGVMVSHGLFATRETQQQAKATATQALRIDETLAEAHTALGYIWHIEWDWGGAETALQRAIQLNPSYAVAYHWYSHHLLLQGRTAESLVVSQRALDLDPLDLLINLHLAWHYYFARQYELAMEQCRKILTMDPQFIRAYLFLGRAAVELARYDEAIAAFQTTINLSGARPDYVTALGLALARSGQTEKAREILHQFPHEARYVSPFHTALLHAALGEIDAAFQCLDMAYLEHSSLLVYLNVDPRLDALRQDTRFNDLLRRVGLSE